MTNDIKSAASEKLKRNFAIGQELHRLTSGKPQSEQMAAIDALAAKSGVDPAVLRKIAGVKPN